MRRVCRFRFVNGTARGRLSDFPSAPQSEERVAEAVRADHAPKLDGTLDDPLWQNSKPISNFRQREPFENKPATEETEVRILYTRHAVYFWHLLSRLSGIASCGDGLADDRPGTCDVSALSLNSSTTLKTKQMNAPFRCERSSICEFYRTSILSLYRQSPGMSPVHLKS
jgi:hypothetical protein